LTELEKRTWAEISLANIRHNYRAIRAALPEGCRFVGVVKANAYGHGALAVSQALEAEGADYLAVSCLDEAMELRDGGIRMPILILGHTPVEFTFLLADNDITQTVTCLKKAEEFSAECVRLGRELRVHIALDTGMSRLGFLCHPDGAANVLRAVSLPGLKAEGVFTHFAVSDEAGENNEAYTRAQYKLFCDTIEAVHEGGFDFALRHCANTGAVLHYPEMALDMARPGLLLYGYGDESGKLGLKPCMRFMTRVSTIKHYPPGTCVSYGRRFVTERHTRMGVVGAGYADGLFRCLSNRCAFWVGDGFAEQRGSICMDMCMIDLTERPEAGVGSEVEIFGVKSSLDALAAAAQTISYELMCAVSKRVPRVYKDF
jgi:alanine racemase